jgi:hypothetical protein
MTGPALLCHQLPPDDDHCQASNIKSKIASYTKSKTASYNKSKIAYYTKSKIASLYHIQKEIFVATDLDHCN